MNALNTLLAFLSGKKTYLTTAVIGLLLFGVWQKWWTVPPEIYAALFAAAIAFLRSGISKSSDPAVPQNVPVQQVAGAAAAALLAVGIFSGCAHVAPGNDPIVVNVERTETVAKSTFDMVLSVDNSQRDFFRTNAPAFHNFCEWLRQPQTIEQTNTLPRAAALLISLDDVKLDYKAARVSSNEVFTALAAVNSAMNQANSWLTVVTNKN